MKINKEPRDKNGKPHGYWETYYPNNRLWCKGYYVHGDEHGYWVIYYYDGELKNKEYYII